MNISSDIVSYFHVVSIRMDWYVYLQWKRKWLRSGEEQSVLTVQASKKFNRMFGNLLIFTRTVISTSVTARTFHKTFHSNKTNHFFVHVNRTAVRLSNAICSSSHHHFAKSSHIRINKSTLYVYIYIRMCAVLFWKSVDGWVLGFC